MLSRYKDKYVNGSIQFVLADLFGMVMASDESLLHLETGTALADFHPFFAAYFPWRGGDPRELTVNCVHLGLQKSHFITDIKMMQVPDGILIVIYDLTQHYNEYQSVAQLRNQSVIKSELVVLKNLELEERENFKNRFIQNFSHELRNPLTTAVTITDLLADTPLTPEQQSMVDFLKSSNDHLRLMLEDILSISMIASGKLVIHQKVFKLANLFEHLSFTYKNKTKEKGLSFTMKIDPRLPEFVEGDRLRLFQVLSNLLDNAVKFTDSGSILFEASLNQVRANRASVHFSVSDTGPGIPKEHQTAVFESFHQGSGHMSREGVGLGLAIVKGFLELMDSQIRVESEPGKGSRFFFDLSLLYPIHQVSGKARVRETAEVKTMPKDRKYKVLIVEDDEYVQTVLFKILTNTGMFYVDLVSDGAKVIQEVINNNFDLILMDIMMPNIPGDQLTRVIRGFPFKDIGNIPIIAVTSVAFGDRIAEYREAGINDVVIKPFDGDDLIRRILIQLEKAKK